MIVVLNKRAKVPADGVTIDTTSKSTTWSRGLSPFYLGPVYINGYQAQTVENAWQYAKVYQQHTINGQPTREYWKWARAGWQNPVAKRYPMGRGAVPLYSLCNGNRLGYIDARKQIYCPLYAEAVERTEAWRLLRQTYEECQAAGKNLYLLDYDGYKTTASFEQILNNPAKKMGHAFVLAMMLSGQRVWEA